MANVADREACIVGCKGVEIVGLVGKGFDRAEGVIKGSVIHCTAPLAIFLVVQVKLHAVGLVKLRQWCGVWKNCVVFEEANVLPAELHCAGL
jgi:hypothetical protein